MTTTNCLLALAIAGLVLVSFPGLSRGDADARRGRELAGECNPSGTLRPSRSHSCEDCCKAGRSYPTYACSPATTGSTKAVMTLNDFDAGGDGGDPSECDGKFHKNTERVVALSTGWYANGRRCNKNIRINANGRSVLAKVVDECDSLHGCDREHAYQPPCRPNVVDASQAVWDALGITGEDVGEYNITWSDA
uniref:Ripening-related protein n=1 Tax=Oryza punctata TaxID=4537 RepID=A0A0E0K2T2_ORYPU